MPEKSAPASLGVTLLLALMAIALWSVPTAAQMEARFSLDSVAAIDLFKGTDGRPRQSVDLSSVIRVSDNWSVQVRPWFFKSSAVNATWSKEIYQAAIRYQHIARTAVRIDAGYLASPLGFGMTEMRADVNPTIQAHPSYFVPLMPFENGGPKVNALAASYPLGAMVAASRATWDVRGGVLATTPARRYALSLVNRTPLNATPTAFIGGGITPTHGLRVGGSFASGPYATNREVTASAPGPHNLRMWTLEGEYAVAYSRVSGEFTRERFAHGSSHDDANTWFVQGVQTITPRWYAAFRHEAISAPPAIVSGPGSDRLSYRTTERTVGYRVTPEWTARASVTSQRVYMASTTDTRAGVQLVWSRRWW
ncbi:MAG: hypothetical protein U0Q11_18330 [Vicinamibacterales bacterium]